MSMSSHIVGIRDLDGQFSKMMAVKIACDSAEVEYPEDVKKYFGAGVDEDEDYIRRQMESIDIKTIVREYTRDMVDVYEIRVADIPKEVKAIRFENHF